MTILIPWSTGFRGICRCLPWWQMWCGVTSTADISDCPNFLFFFRTREGSLSVFWYLLVLCFLCFSGTTPVLAFFYKRNFCYSFAWLWWIIAEVAGEVWSIWVLGLWLCTKIQPRLTISGAKIFVRLLSLKCYLFWNQMDIFFSAPAINNNKRRREEKCILK